MRTVKPLSQPLPDGACNEAFTLRSVARSSDRYLAAFAAKELRPGVLDLGYIYLSRLQPFIRNAMLIVIFAALI